VKIVGVRILANEISEEDVWDTLSNVMHPEIDSSLVELGMIRDVVVKENKVTVVLALPFLGVPIRDYLVGLICEAVMKLGVEIEVKLVEMTPEELQAFLNMEREKWKG